MNYEALYSLLSSRRSIRKFEDRELDAGQIKKIIEAGTTAPSSLNSQPWRFVVIKSREKKKQLRGIYTHARQKLKLYEQDTSFVEKATPVVVLCEDSDYGKTVSCAMCIQNMLAAAESLGLGGLPSVTILQDLESLEDLEKLVRAEKEKIVLVTFFGCKAENPGQKPKKGLGELVFEDSLR